MKKRNRILPTETSFGGGLLNRNNKPTELQRYKKNTKQKKILIGTILLFILIIGGIKLYRTFALYKEEKSFNVLKGIVPDFHTYYKESILNGAYPELKGDLIPVKIDEEGTVRKADINEKWYSYEKQEWANAIIKQNSYDALDAYGKVNSATKSDGYVEFDGVDDYIDLGLENYDFDNTASIAIRLSFNELKNTYQSFFGNWESSGFGLKLLLNNKIAFDVYLEGETNYQTLAIDVIPEINKTYTLVGTYDGKEIKIYVDGELMGSKKIIGKIKPSSIPFNIGANPDSDIHYEYASIHVYQVAIFDRALTEEEIKNNFSEEIKIHDNSELLKYVDFTEREEEAEEIIPEDIIESYFVWIPKYRYRIFEMGEYSQRETIEYESKVQPIEIKFGLTNTIEDEEECIAPPSGENGNCTVNKWMTHPAFTAFDTKGIWVGKFETGYKGATSASEATKDGDASKIIIKPNEYSWRNITVGTMYKNSLSYNEDLNSHMMKNTEWGAVAYLTNSIYGRCPNNKCSDIRINNNMSRLTGYAAKTAPTTGFTGTNELCSAHSGACNEQSASEKGKDGTANYQYFNTESVIASTTGNYTGVYDMNGGSWEYVMGVMMDESEKLIYLNSGLTENDLKDEKYYDTYKYNHVSTDYSNRILGDATGEMGPFIVEKYTGTTSTAVEQVRTICGWYHDETIFIWNGNPWFLRGGNYPLGLGGGVLTFAHDSGTASTDRVFRITLAF